MKIHFICRGNIYRSRIAEAYTRYLTEGKNISVSSSGIEADRTEAEISPLTLAYLESEGLDQYISDLNLQTTQELLDNADVLAFMNDSVYKDAIDMFDVQQNKTEVWHIPDMPGVYEDIKNQVQMWLENKKDTYGASDGI